MMTSVTFPDPSSKQPYEDQNEHDDEQDVNQVAGLRNPWKACPAKISQQPENDEDDDEQFEHVSLLFMASIGRRPGSVRGPEARYFRRPLQTSPIGRLVPVAEYLISLFTARLAAASTSRRFGPRAHGHRC
jgi:hypothetical protein